MASAMDHSMPPVNMEEAMNRQLENDGFFDEAVSMQNSKDGPQMHTPMHHWLRNDSPWSLVTDPIPPSDHPHLRPNFLTTQPSHDAFMDYRSTGMPSECDTIPGDSGYGSSCMPRSIENTSVYGDDSYPLSHNVEQDLRSFHLNNPLDTMADPNISLGLSGHPQGSTIISDSLQCNECGETVRTKSELKKHELRHNKPFRCQHENCNRYNNGFASQNDLDRHYKTVHRNYKIGKSYICQHDNCVKANPKLWPRADNFRSHLHRVHRIKLQSDDDLGRYVNHPKPSPQPHISEDLSGVGTRLQEPIVLPSGADQGVMPGHPAANQSIGEFPEIQAPRPSMPHTNIYLPHDNLLLPPAPSRSNAQPSQNTNASPGQSGFYNTHKSRVPSIEIETAPEPMEITPDSESTSPAPKSEPPHSELSPLDDEKVPESESESESESGSEPEEPTKEVKDFASELEEALDGGRPKEEELELILKKIPAHIMQKFLRENGSAAAVGSPAQTPFSDVPGFDKTKHCDKCGKQFNRPCELTKHLKRHSKPYGCTVYRCDKSFGSKNDWKRHEQGQHSPNETWTCDVSECSESFNRREDFEEHLREIHKETTDSIKEKLENNRRGNHCSPSFWCGFCKVHIDFKGDKSTKDQRFDHIDDHFMGRSGSKKWNIQEWRPVEEASGKPAPVAEANRKRKPGRQVDPRPAKQQHTMSG